MMEKARRKDMIGGEKGGVELTRHGGGGTLQLSSPLFWQAPEA